MAVSDENLAVQYHNGDEQAFEQLVRRYAATVRSLAVNMLGDGHMADDIVQQVFLRVHRNADKLPEINNFRAWLLTIATNRCLTMIRKRTTKPDPLPMDNVIAGLLAGPDTTITAVERNERVVRLCEALNTLKPEQRATLVLHYQEGLSYAQIAERMDTTVNTIKSRFRRTKERLRQQLKDLYPESIS